MENVMVQKFLSSETKIPKFGEIHREKTKAQNLHRLDREDAFA